MAQTILEQVLENVQRGTIVPTWGESWGGTASGAPSTAQVERIVELILSRVELELMSASSRAADATMEAQLSLPLNQRELTALFGESFKALLDFSTGSDTELHLLDPEHDCSLLDSAPSHDEHLQHGALDELREVLRSQHEESQRDPQLVATLGDVARGFERARPTHDRDRNQEALEDIHKMIEFLK